MRSTYIPRRRVWQRNYYGNIKTFEKLKAVVLQTLKTNMKKVTVNTGQGMFSGAIYYY